MIVTNRLIRTGALVEETRVVMRNWDPELGVRENLHGARRKNLIGLRSEALAKVIFATLHRRLSLLPPEELSALARLANRSVEPGVWQAVLHWHGARVDRLYYEFVTDWLYNQYRQDVAAVATQDIIPHVEDVYVRETGEVRLSDYGRVRAARDLLRMATDFGILTKTNPRRFVSYFLPPTALLYILHNMAERGWASTQIVESRDWRIFLMDESDVERELFQLHQLRKLRYHVAGTVRELTLPFPSAADFAGEGDL